MDFLNFLIQFIFLTVTKQHDNEFSVGNHQLELHTEHKSGSKLAAVTAKSARDHLASLTRKYKGEKVYLGNSQGWVKKMTFLFSCNKYG